jgi:prepilin-type N-terminal cleavage/methylation domain-containing protein/prepilin-type processing-associated H-X9-DG protein
VVKTPRIIKREKAFTLIELLAVITIITILAALGSQGLIRALESAHSSQCMSNMRQYGAAASLYTVENPGFIAPPESSGGGWYSTLLPYLGKDSAANYALRCPTFTRTYKWASASFHTGYGMNLYFSSASGIAGAQSQEGFRNPARIAQIPQPSKTPLFYDNESALGGSAWGGYCFDGGSPWYYHLYAAHKGGYNICFLDGHTEWVKFNPTGQFKGNGAGDYSQFQWKPY